MRERGMRVQFQPHVHAEIRERAHGRRKTDRLPKAPRPAGGDPRPPLPTLPRHGAKEWDRAWLRPDVGEFRFQGLRRRPHERVVKRMIDLYESGKGALRLEFDGHRLKRKPRA